MAATTFIINGKTSSVEAEPDTPLLWVVREQLKLTGTKFGRSVRRLHSSHRREGRALLPDFRIESGGTESHHHRRPFDEWTASPAESVDHGASPAMRLIMQAATLLATNKKPTREQIVAHMDGNICRCGTYPRIVRAIQRAAREA